MSIFLASLVLAVVVAVVVVVLTRPATATAEPVAAPEPAATEPVAASEPTAEPTVADVDITPRGCDEIETGWIDPRWHFASANLRNEEIRLFSEEEARMHSVELAVHNGMFHADDIISTALCALWGRMSIHYGPFTVVRTRDSKILSAAVIVADVGGGRFDHHQPGAEEILPGIPHCGASLLARDMGLLEAYPELIPVFVAIAAHDNGKQPPSWASEGPFEALHRLNPPWNFSKGQNASDEAFMEAVKMARTLLVSVVRNAYAAEKAASVVNGLKDEAINEIPAGLPGWQAKLVALDSPRLVLFQAPEGTWMVQSVPASVGSFECKAPAPEAWRGLRDGDLESASGINGAVFCHRGGFISGWKTREAAMQAAEAVLASLR